MMSTHLLHSDGRIEWNTRHDLALTCPQNTTVWVDIEVGEEQDIEALESLKLQWSFHPLAIEDCVHPQSRAKYERYPNHDFLVLLGLDHATEAPLDTLPICVFLKGRLLVTYRSREVRAVETVKKRIQGDGIIAGADRLVHALLDTLIDEFIPLLDEYESSLDELEHQAIQSARAEILDQLVKVRRDLLHIRRILGPFQEVIRRYTDEERGEVEADCKLLFRDVQDHILAIQDLVSVRLEICNGAIQTHNNATNERLNKVMKYLAVVSTLALPMTIISGIFGMNFDVIPTTHHANGFYSAIIMMFSVAAVLLGIFRWRRWI
jgi:magnesium transporter